MTVVIGTEGEKNAMVANAIRNVPCISIPGVTSYGVELKKHGIQVFIGSWQGKIDKGLDDVLLLRADISLKLV